MNIFGPNTHIQTVSIVGLGSRRSVAKLSFVFSTKLGGAVVTDHVTRLVRSFAFQDQCLCAMQFN